jgi:rhodanese-related sulfurtransferase
MEIDVNTTKRWLDNGCTESGRAIAFLDCREPSEYDTAHIEGADLVPMSQWPPTVDQLNAWKDKQVVVHCHHGGRSLRVAQWFRQNGFEDALSMAGGIDQWSAEIDATVPRY